MLKKIFKNFYHSKFFGIICALSFSLLSIGTAMIVVGTTPVKAEGSRTFAGGYYTTIFTDYMNDDYQEIAALNVFAYFVNGQVSLDSNGNAPNYEEDAQQAGFGSFGYMKDLGMMTEAQEQAILDVAHKYSGFALLGWGGSATQRMWDAEGNYNPDYATYLEEYANAEDDYDRETVNDKWQYVVEYQSYTQYNREFVQSGPTPESGYYLFEYPDIYKGDHMGNSSALWQLKRTVSFDAGEGKFDIKQDAASYSEDVSKFTFGLGDNAWYFFEDRTDILNYRVTMPTREGYVFGGWWTGEDGTGIQYYNSNGEMIYANADDDADTEGAEVTLYAYWIDTWAHSDLIEEPSIITKIQNGEPHEYYEIDNAKKLAWIAYKSYFEGETFDGTNADGTPYSIEFLQTKDINLAGHEWMPIGLNTRFGGAYHGGGYTISNMTTISLKEGDKYWCDRAGLFASRNGPSGYISGVKLINPVVYANEYAGGILAYGNLALSCGVANACIFGAEYAGGIAGYAENVKDCTANGVYIDDGVRVFGGVAGKVGYECWGNTINGLELGMEDVQVFGGMVGEYDVVGNLPHGIFNNNVENLYVTLSVSSVDGFEKSINWDNGYEQEETNVYFGGLIGKITKKSAGNINLYNNIVKNPKIEFEEEAAINRTYAGGLIGYVSGGIDIYDCHVFADDLADDGCAKHYIWLGCDSNLFMGGLIGFAFNESIYNCSVMDIELYVYETEEYDGEPIYWTIGGLIGSAESEKVKNCFYSAEKLCGEIGYTETIIINPAGRRLVVVKHGLIGSSIGSRIDGCANILSYTSYCDGAIIYGTIVGYALESAISNCYSSNCYLIVDGYVNDIAYIGGVAGHVSSPGPPSEVFGCTVEYFEFLSYNFGTTSDNTFTNKGMYIGGVIGLATAEKALIEKCMIDVEAGIYVDESDIVHFGGVAAYVEYGIEATQCVLWFYCSVDYDNPNYSSGILLGKDNSMSTDSVLTDILVSHACYVSELAPSFNGIIKDIIVNDELVYFIDDETAFANWVLTPEGNPIPKDVLHIGASLSAPDDWLEWFDVNGYLKNML